MSYLQNFNYTYVPTLGPIGIGTGGFQHSAFGPHSRFTSYNTNNNNNNNNNALPSLLQNQYQNIPIIPNSIVPNPNNPNVDYFGNPTEPQHQQQQQINYDNSQSEILNQDEVYSSYTSQQQQQQQPASVGAVVRKRKAKKVSQRNVGIPFNTPVTPIQGPIYIKDGLVPVVPLYSYPAVNNGTFYQIPILWTALSVALGVEIRGEILRGLPCIKRLNQLFCPTAGNTYPLDHIEKFIDENKALIKRMYGEFVMMTNTDAGGFTGPVAGNYLRRSAREIYENEVPDYFTKPRPNNLNNNQGNETTEDHLRKKRQTVNPRNGGPTTQPKSNRVDSCESKVEITTPYWAANSAGKVRAIVNTQHFEQAIHQEVCAKTVTARCTGDCGCEQKYKWHRLLAYDPDNDCKGIFMDWFLFPSCCVCRCNP